MRNANRKGRLSRIVFREERQTGSTSTLMWKRFPQSKVNSSLTRSHWFCNKQQIKKLLELKPLKLKIRGEENEHRFKSRHWCF